MARDNTLTLIILAVGGYFVYQNWPAIQATFTGMTTGTGGPLLCKFPDGSTIAMPAGNACPYDAGHGGQSTPCYPATYTGTIPTGGARC